MATLRDYRLQSYAGPSTNNPFQALAEEDVATSPLEASTLNPEAPAFTPSSLGGAPTDSSLSRAEKKKIRRSRVRQNRKMERSLANLIPGSKSARVASSLVTSTGWAATGTPIPAPSATPGQARAPDLKPVTAWGLGLLLLGCFR